MSATTPTRSRRAAGVLLRGIIAGLSGTLAMTVVAGLERTLSRRRGTGRTGRVAARALRQQMSEPAAARLGQVVHWTYGAVLGLPAALMREAGVPIQAALVAHMAMAWLPWLRALRRTGVDSARDLPAAREIALDAATHAVYVGVTWLVLSRIALFGRACHVRRRPPAGPAPAGSASAATTVARPGGSPDGVEAAS